MAAGVIAGPVLFEERLAARGWRAWRWLPFALAITVLVIDPAFAPVTLAAWVVNVIRFRRTVVRVDPWTISVGRKRLPLATLDLATLGRASNTWPWRVWNPRWLGANPIWTADSVGITGRDGSRRVWVSVGTDRRDELVAVLTRAVGQARAGAAVAVRVPPPGWYADPWDPVSALRWWNGASWTGYVARRPGRAPGVRT